MKWQQQEWVADGEKLCKLKTFPFAVCKVCADAAAFSADFCAEMKTICVQHNCTLLCFEAL